MRAYVDREGCIGCGMCAELCPAVFRMAEDGKSEVYGEVTAENLDAARDAEDNCPVSVIRIEE